MIGSLLMQSKKEPNGSFFIKKIRKIKRIYVLFLFIEKKGEDYDIFLC